MEITVVNAKMKITRSIAGAVLFVFGCGHVCGQRSAFEVASVKVNANPPRMGMGAIHYSPDTLTARGVSMWLLVRWAYGVGSFQIAGPVSMQEAPYYDIDAKPGGAVPPRQLRAVCGIHLPICR